MPPSKDRRMVKIQREYLIRTTDQLKALYSEPQPNKLEIEQLCKTFDEHFTLLSEHQLNLELKVDDDELDHMISENIQFTKGIIDVRNEAKQYFVELRDSTASANKEVPKRENIVPKLPKLDLPTFSGQESEDFFFFLERFNSTIDCNSLSDSTKFAYLKNLLRGEALRSIAGLSPTGDNYETAKSLLSNHYGCKERVITRHLQSLASLEIKGSNLKSLRCLYDGVKVHMRSLESLGVPETTYGVMLAPSILGKLPENLRMEWARDSEGNENDIQFLLEFILKEIKRKERCEVFGFKEREEMKIYEKSQRHNALVQQTKPDCGFCDKCHFGKCFSIQGLSVKKIVKRARMRKLCFICLSRNHLQADCKSNLTCSKCNDKHNTLLHGGL